MVGTREQGSETSIRLEPMFIGRKGEAGCLLLDQAEPRARLCENAMFW